MRLKYFFGVFLVVAISAAAVAMSGGKLAAFVDLPTYVVIIAIPAAIAFASWPVRDIGRAFSAPSTRRRAGRSSRSPSCSSPSSGAGSSSPPSSAR